MTDIEHSYDNIHSAFQIVSIFGSKMIHKNYISFSGV